MAGKQAPTPAALTYYIVEGVLVGSVGPKLVFVSALSGGGGGFRRVNTPF